MSTAVAPHSKATHMVERVVIYDHNGDIINLDEGVIQTPVMGVSGTVFSGSQIEKDFNDNLNFQEGMDVFERMRTYPIISEGLARNSLPIRHLTWDIEEPNDDPTPSQKEQTIFVKENVKRVIPGILRDVELMLAFGFTLFEIENETKEVSPGKFRHEWKTFHPRLPQSVCGWIRNDDGSQLVEIEQNVDNSGITRMFAHNVLRFTHNQEGKNFEGRSAQRHAFYPWNNVLSLQNFENMQKERYGVGIATIWLPEGLEGDNLTAAKAEANTLLSALRSSHAPRMTFPFGWLFEIVTPQGGKGGVDILSTIKYYDKLIMNALQAEDLDFGVDGKGSFALDKSRAKTHEKCQQSIVEEIEQPMNGQHKSNGEHGGIQTLVDMNFPADEIDGYPKLKMGKLTAEDPQAFAEFTEKMANIGALDITDDVKERVRKIGGFKKQDVSSIPVAVPPNTVVQPRPQAQQQQPVRTSETDDDYDQREMSEHPGRKKKKKKKKSKLKERELIEGYDERVNLAEVINTLDEAKQIYKDTVGNAALKGMTPMISFLIKPIKEKMFKEINKLNPVNKGGIIRAALKVSRRMFEFGEDQFSDEIDKQRRAGGEKAVDRIRAKRAKGEMVLQELDKSSIETQLEFEGFEDIKAQVAAANITNRLRTSLIVTATALATLPTIPPDNVIRAALREAGTKSIETAVRFESGAVISQSFQFGRRTASRFLQDEIVDGKWSTILDENACDPCRLLNGKDIEEVNYEPPNRGSSEFEDCDGGDSCRCIAIYTLKEEETSA